MASRREMEALITLSGRISPTLQNALRQTQRGISGVESSSTLMGKTMNKGFELAAKAAAIGTAAVGAGLTYIGVKGTKLASDLTEVQNVVDTTFGQNSKAIDAWSVTALKSFGLSELSAKQYSSTMGAMLKSSGLSANSTLIMSKNLSALSGDLSSFYNVTQDDAFEKIRAGISGETEPLKQLGINMSVANLSAYALSKGMKVSYDKMDQASQTALRYNYLLSVTKDAQGDFAKTAGTSLANQMRIASTSFDQLSSKIMTAALPGLTKLLQSGNKLLDGAMGNPEFIKKFQDYITLAMDKIIELVPKAIGFAEQLWPSIQNVYNIAATLFNFISNNWSLIEPIIWGIVFAQVAFNVAAKAALIIETVTKAIGFARAAMIFYRDGASIATIAQWAFNGAMDANVIGIVIIALAALGTAIYEIITHWKEITTWIGNTWDKLKNNPIVEFIALTNPFTAGLFLIAKYWTEITGAIGKAWDFLTKWNGTKAQDKNINTNYASTSGGAATNTSDNGLNSATSYVLKKHASGGFSNRPAIFGEAGPEAAIPLKYKSPRSLSILNQTAKAIGADNGSASSGQVQLIYSPVIQGGSNPEIENILKTQAEEFKAWLENYLSEKERVSFG